MEYINGNIINDVVKYFKGIALPVKTDKQVFVFIVPLAAIKPAVVLCGIEGPTNVSLGYIVLEGSWVELYDSVHLLSITKAWRQIKPTFISKSLSYAKG